MSIDLGVVAQTLVATVKDLDAERMSRYREYLDFFEGHQWEERPRGNQKQRILNYARRLLVKGVSYMWSQPVSFHVTDPAGRDTPATRAAQLALEDVYRANGLDRLDPATALDAAVLGDGAFKVTWSAKKRRPVVAAVDPRGLWAWRDPDDPRELVRVLQLRNMTRAEVEARGWALPDGSDAVAPNPSIATVPVVEEWTAERWRVEVAGGIVVDRGNPYGWIPYVVFPNQARPHEPWGASDLEDLMDVCRELNERSSTVARILEISGYPITVLENVDGAEGIRADAGAVWELPADSKAYLLDMLQGGGVRLHLDYIELLYRALHDLSETPRTAFGDSGRALSGVALEVEIQPLVQKVQRKRTIWDDVFRERNRMILDLAERFGGVDVGGLRESSAVWGGVTPTDREALVQETSTRLKDGTLAHTDAMHLLGSQDPEGDLERVLADRRKLGELQAELEQEARGGDAERHPDAG